MRLVSADLRFADSTRQATATPNIPRPEIQGFKTWSFDPVASSAGQIIAAAGVLNLAKCEVRSPITVSSVLCNVTAAGATLNNVGFALYTTSGALLTSSVNANGATAAAFQATGFKTVTFTSQTLTADFYVGCWFTGNTMPTLSRAAATSLMGIGLAAPNFRFATANTGLTNAAPATLGAQTASPNPLFFGLT